MPDSGSSNLISELRRMAESAPVDEQTFQRLMLASMAGCYQLIAEQAQIIQAWDGHEHPIIEQRIGTLEKRDIVTGIGAIIAAAVIAWFGPHK